MTEPRRRRRVSPAAGARPSSLLLEEPVETLPPTARASLAAARSLLVRDGFKALSLSAIAAEAGEAKGSVRYHFGSKDGLVTVLVDSLAHDANRALITECAAPPPGDARIHALLDGELRIVADAESFRRSSRSCPTRCGSPSCGSVWRRSTTATARPCAAASAPPPGHAAELRQMSVLMIAIVDGLAIQYGLDPEKADLSGAIGLWESLVRSHVDRSTAMT